MPRWGMVIDLSACTGCGSCTIACKVENNVPIAHPRDMEESRSFSWMQLISIEEREEDHGAPKLVPRPCMQCDNPPCVLVCPVEATRLDVDGIVSQVYDRCIGCRYCTNNCPYTVKYFNWHTPEWPDELREGLNPDVPLRPKGVVEKCTFCHHRLHRASDQAKAERRPLRPGDYVPACLEVCPNGAIAFGDLDDPESEVSKLSHSPRAFRELEDLGTEPKVHYLREDR